MRDRLKVAATVLGLALGITGCAREAAIVVPADLAANAQRLELTGMGGWGRGSFRLGGSAGRFTRSAVESLGEDGFERRKFGGGSFEVEGPEVSGRLSADCDYQESERGGEAVTIVAERFTYHCRFRRNGALVSGGLSLTERPTRPGHVLSGRTRQGVMHLDGRTVSIRAIHHMEGGRVPTMDPLGYAFEMDGRPIGAIDLNGMNKTIFAAGDGRDRELALSAGLALAILWY